MGEGRLSQRALRMQAIWSWSLGERKSFREVTVAWSCRGIWTYVVYVRDAIHWFLHKFNVDPVDTVQAFKAKARLMCPATAPLLNRTPASFHLPQFTAAGIPLSEWRHNHGWSEPGAASLLCSYGRCFIQSWQNGRSGCQESRVRWRQNEGNLPHWAGAVNMTILLIQPSSAAAEWVFSHAYPGRAAFSGQQQAAFKIMWRPAWCFTTLIAETITLMCSSSLHIIISKLEHIKQQPSSHNLTNDTQHQAAHSWLNKHNPWRAYFLYNFESQCRGLKLISSLKPSFKAGPPLDLSFWSFLTFLHHGIEEVERHLLWKFYKKIRRKSWSNVPPKLVACIGFLYKVVHKIGRLRKFNRSRGI